ncbi:hypothetical protein HPB47_016543 [Ixodes persulcatus]|uniref:Uncharacterized protein n=1 Tax=Ixodes persulcatus TaxID=34615 RepID=A0AC60QRU6_IXOPE|nr:hypothetical protein HPB47_016543 [Ixodes persulcatus]
MARREKTMTKSSPLQSIGDVQLLDAGRRGATKQHPGRVNHPTDAPDIKIIVRPRDRLNISKPSDALIRDGVLRAATVTIAEAEDDRYRSCVRPMGNTNSVIEMFEGPNVPFYVYYRGAEYRYYLHKKKVEVCSACGRIGPRADVCPTPDKQQCREC